VDLDHGRRQLGAHGLFVVRLWGRDPVQGNYDQLVIAVAKMYEEEPARAAMCGMDNFGL
tara:strand:+ start:402 stop:578 length:177 start_codon:yes stop_codon:yes gene_type:complete